MEDGHFLFELGEGVTDFIQIFGDVGKHQIKEHFSLNYVSWLPLTHKPSFFRKSCLLVQHSWDV